MSEIEETIENLNSHGFTAQYFSTGTEAVEYLVSQFESETIGFGGSKTVESLGLFERLGERNHVFWHWKQDMDQARNRVCKGLVVLWGKMFGIDQVEVLIINEELGY